MPRLTVLYDADCRLCQAAVERLRRRDRWNRIELLPLRHPGVAQRFPRLDPDHARAEMAAVDTAGNIAFGVDAYARIGSLLPRWRRVAWLLRVPGLHALAQAAYRWVARNRYRWNRERCSADSCLRPPQ